jgi:hypothetical protein
MAIVESLFPQFPPDDLQIEYSDAVENENEKKGNI